MKFKKKTSGFDLRNKIQQELHKKEFLLHIFLLLKLGRFKYIKGIMVVITFCDGRTMVSQST